MGLYERSNIPHTQRSKSIVLQPEDRIRELRLTRDEYLVIVDVRLRHRLGWAL